jgi:uncharacterized protein YoxC
MEQNNITILVVAGIAFIVLVVFLIWENTKDRKLLSPDAADSVEETHMDQVRKSDKIKK